MKNKKLILFLIILFPSVFWLILEFSTINSKKLPHFGPTSLVGKDSVFYEVNPSFYSRIGEPIINLDTNQYPVFAISFIKPSYQAENFRMAGLTEYAQYKRDKIKEIPFFIVTPCDSSQCFDEFKKLEKGNDNIRNLFWNTNSFDSLNAVYFKGKPIHIDYSFFVLVDANRNIRGYYDSRYVGEIKRLIEEYQHLRLKEEKKNLINTNKIESK